MLFAAFGTIWTRNHIWKPSDSGAGFTRVTVKPSPPKVA